MIPKKMSPFTFLITRYAVITTPIIAKSAVIPSVEKFVLNGIEEKQLFFDSKTIFQEMMQSITTETIHYELVGEEGPDHCKTFSVELFVGDRSAGKGTGKSKKAAEQAAAYDAIKKIKR